MNADERIEKLLNAFGQTMADLPNPNDWKYVYVYEAGHRENAHNTAIAWEGEPLMDADADYICHLCDVIDRMEVALETARRLCWMLTESYTPDIRLPGGPENWRIHDKFLTGDAAYKEEEYDEQP